MKIRDVMSRDVQIARPQDTIQDIAARMAAGDFGFLPVAEGDQLIGTITDRDLTIRALAKGAAPSTSGNLEIVKRSLPAPQEVREELKRLSPSLSRCVRSPAAGLDVDLTVDGVSGRVSKVDVHAPELTPGRLECLKEGFSDLHVAPFTSEQLKYRHRFVW
jgi:CBS domain-containing protein